MPMVNLSAEKDLLRLRLFVAVIEPIDFAQVFKI